MNPETTPDAPFEEDMIRRDNEAFARSASVTGPYTLGPDSLPQNGVPRGIVSQYHWKSERIYPGTERDYWLYVPEQYDGTQLACLIIFQDGEWYLRPDVNVPVVLDKLIHQQQIPLTIALFVSPGTPGPGNPVYGGDTNRSVEYDSLGDRYARFLVEELIPEVERQYRIVSDPKGRAICGISSGGICAFTAAWERPDAFGNVISHCGSFSNIRGGDEYPWLVRKTPRKPIRVFLQTGTNDVDVVFGNWALANKQMAAALAYRDYDYQFVMGEGGHNLKHGASIFPDTLCWIWRDYPE
jgi:enterochelin esterase-like enzyme